MKILNIGSLNIDYVYQVDHMVAPGETLMAFKRDVYCGGKGLNQSIAMSRAGLQVNHAGCIGAEGMMLTDLLKENDVNVDAVEVLMESTGHAIIQVDASGQNCILLYGGANRLLTKEYIDDVLKDSGKDDILLLQNEVNNLDYIIDSAYEKGLQIILNPSPYDSALDACDMTKISLFLLNEVEGKQMTGYEEPDDIESLKGDEETDKVYADAAGLTVSEYYEMRSLNKKNNTLTLKFDGYICAKIASREYVFKDTLYDKYYESYQKAIDDSDLSKASTVLMEIYDFYVRQLIENADIKIY
jgi:ribokinase